jgi:ribosomal protein L18
MGRPLKKDIYGTKVTRSFTGAQAGILVEGYFGGSLATDYQIVKQRGKSTYVFISTATDEFTEAEKVGSITGTNLKVGKLVATQPDANGEIRILGSTTGQTPGTTAIAKLTKRIATDFSGNRYKWYLDNDSSADVLVLIPV